MSSVSYQCDASTSRRTSWPRRTSRRNDGCQPHPAGKASAVAVDLQAQIDAVVEHPEPLHRAAAERPARIELHRDAARGRRDRARPPTAGSRRGRAARVRCRPAAARSTRGRARGIGRHRCGSATAPSGRSPNASARAAPARRGWAPAAIAIQRPRSWISSCRSRPPASGAIDARVRPRWSVMISIARCYGRRRAAARRSVGLDVGCRTRIRT